MSKAIRRLIAPMLLLGIIYHPSSVTAATCEATSFDSLKALLTDVTKCPDPVVADRYYIELRLNSTIDTALDIPANTTLKGNLISDPGKAAALESNFIPDDASYQSGFNPFKKGKPTPPDCLVTLNDGAKMDNIHLTKVYAKAAVCVKNNTATTNVAIQGPNLDMSAEMQNAFIGVSFMGSNNILGGVVFSINKGQQTFLPAGFTNNVILPEAPKPVEPPAALPPPADATTPGGDAGPAKPPASAATDVNTVILKNPDTGESVLVPMLSPLTPEVASPMDSESSCSLVPDRQAASALVPLGMILLTLGVSAFAAYRFRMETQRVRKKQKE